MENIIQQIVLLFFVIIVLSTAIFMTLVLLTPIILAFEYLFPQYHQKLYQKLKFYKFLSDFGENISATRGSTVSNINYSVTNATYKLEFFSSVIATLIKLDKINQDKKLKFWLEYYNKYTFYLPLKNENDLAEFSKLLTLNNLKTTDEITYYKISDNRAKILFIDLLFRMSVCDGNYSEEEDYFIRLTAKEVGMKNSLFQKIKSKYIIDKSEFDDLLNFMKIFEENSTETELKKAYEILKIPENSSKEMAKKAYIKLAKQYHPDKVAYLGEEYVEKANKMIQKINSAYELIEKQ